MIRRIFLTLAIVSCAAAAQIAKAPAEASLPFEQNLEQWKAAIVAHDTAAVAALYSVRPPGQVVSSDGKQQFPSSDETGFWERLAKAGMADTTVTVKKIEEQQGLKVVSLEVVFRAPTPNGPRPRYVTERQAWQPQDAGWRIVTSMRSPVMKIRPPEKLDMHLYPPPADAPAEIQAAVQQAAAQHKRIILIFGGNFFYDCQVLESALREPDIAPLARHFEFVHVNVGDDRKANGDLLAKYRVPIDKGVPALAVLSDTGALLYSQQNGEFESTRTLDPDDLIAFLRKWAPPSR